MDSSIILILAVLIIAVIYFIPTIVAYARGRLNKGAIFCMNFFLGWLFIGWVIALIWATKDDGREEGNY